MSWFEDTLEAIPDINVIGIGGTALVVLKGYESHNGLDINSKVDEYSDEFWVAVNTFIDNHGTFLGGRYGTAKVFSSQPFAQDYSMAQMCQVVQLCFGERKLLGYTKQGSIVSYKNSVTCTRDHDASKRNASTGDVLLQGAVVIQSKEQLAGVLKTYTPKEGIHMAELKRLIFEATSMALCETALGETKLSDILAQKPCSDVVDLDTLNTHTMVVRPKGIFGNAFARLKDLHFEPHQTPVVVKGRKKLPPTPKIEDVIERTLAPKKVSKKPPPALTRMDSTATREHTDETTPFAALQSMNVNLDYCKEEGWQYLADYDWDAWYEADHDWSDWSKQWSQWGKSEQKPVIDDHKNWDKETVAYDPKSWDKETDVYDPKIWENQAKTWEDRSKIWGSHTRDWEGLASSHAQSSAGHAKDWESHAKDWDSHAQSWERPSKEWDSHAQSWEKPSKDWKSGWEKPSDWDKMTLPDFYSAPMDHVFPEKVLWMEYAHIRHAMMVRAYERQLNYEFQMSNPPPPYQQPSFYDSWQ